ncbi:MAG TPA: hypothetical protein VJJ21_00770 [Candidatus Nanoarchaeia archaeon]|nr:hypothetical protein [Candidatus Nanoarchaeia archaeon]
MTGNQLQEHRKTVQNLFGEADNIYQRLINTPGLNGDSLKILEDYLAVSTKTNSYLAILIAAGINPSEAILNFVEETRKRVIPEVRTAIETAERDIASILKALPRNAAEAKLIIPNYMEALERLEREVLKAGEGAIK